MLFDAGLFPDGPHEPEVLYRIGPFLGDLRRPAPSPAGPRLPRPRPNPPTPTHPPRTEERFAVTITQPDLSVFETLESEVRSYCRGWPTVFDRAQGSRMYDEDGHAYLDFFAGAGSLNYGHNNPVLKRALIDYLERDGVTHGLDMSTTAKRAFLETFQDLILRPRDLPYKVMFPGPTGTNAVESALKLARKVKGRESIVSFTNAFHGMSLGSLAVTGNAFKRAGAGIPLVHGTPMPFDNYFDGTVPDFLWFERLLEDQGSGLNKPAAVIVETVQGEGGINVARAEWLRALADAVRAPGHAADRRRHPDGLRPHRRLLLLRGGGHHAGHRHACPSPSAATACRCRSCLFKPELDIWEPGEHNGTFRGNNPAFVTATAALETYWADGRDGEADPRPRRAGRAGAASRSPRRTAPTSRSTAAAAWSGAWSSTTRTRAGAVAQARLRTGPAHRDLRPARARSSSCCRR